MARHLCPRYGTTMAHIVLDKSFLDGANPQQIKSLCDDHTVLMPDVLFYELITTDEASRKPCFNKFPDTNNPVELIPNIGTLLRYELSTRKPCSPLYDRRENIVLIFITDCEPVLFSSQMINLRRGKIMRN